MTSYLKEIYNISGLEIGLTEFKKCRFWSPLCAREQQQVVQFLMLGSNLGTSLVKISVSKNGISLELTYKNFLTRNLSNMTGCFPLKTDTIYFSPL